MDLKILSKKEEPLLSRTKLEAEVSFDKATPSKSEIRNALAKSLGRDEKLIVVKGIHTGYKVRKAKHVSYVYENEEIMKSIEPRHKEHKEIKAESKGQKTAEEKKE
ncbi:hypothetical protein HYW19_02945 [Candidatus Woesearchaeota archaeon]|nr:hypothetical protein [Candidatus Woesearchaeota archaeon]